MSRRSRVVLLVCLAVIASGAGAWGYYYTAQPAYRLRRGQAAIRAGDYQAGAAEAVALEADGYGDEALLLRGEALLLRGESLDGTDEFIAALHLLDTVRSEGCKLQATALAGRCLLRLG